MTWQVIRRASGTGVIVLATLAADGSAQARRMQQDLTLDNLALPTGTVTASHGSLPPAMMHGTAGPVVVFIAGIGFGVGAYEEASAALGQHARVITVGLPGFGGTDPWARPDSSVFGSTPWVDAATVGIPRKCNSTCGCSGIPRQRPVFALTDVIDRCIDHIVVN